MFVVTYLIQFFSLVVLIIFVKGFAEALDVKVIVPPEGVIEGGRATLLCLYDLQGIPLYNVKWYRGTHEFYRFEPNDRPMAKYFPFAGLHLDMSMSNKYQVTLTNIGKHLAGNYSCEVTADAPTFSTAVVSAVLNVVSKHDYNKKPVVLFPNTSIGPPTDPFINSSERNEYFIYTIALNISMLLGLYYFLYN